MHLFIESALHHVKRGDEHRSRRFREQDDPWPDRRSHYEKVVTYEVNNWPEQASPILLAEEVYHLSQGRPDLAPEDSGLSAFTIELHKPADQVRSTSVGDVVELSLRNKLEDGNPIIFGPLMMQVDRFGFSRISAVEHQPGADTGVMQHHDMRDTEPVPTDDGYEGHSCQNCGGTIRSDGNGTGSPIGSMHQWCAEMHRRKNPTMW